MQEFRWGWCKLVGLSDPSQMQPRYKTYLVSAIVFVCFFALYQLSLALQGNYFPPKRHFGRVFFSGDNLIRKVMNLSHNIKFIQLKGDKVRIDFIKHPLYPAVAVPLYSAAEWMYRPAGRVLGHNLAYAFPSAFLGALNVCLSFLLFMRNGGNWSLALGFALLYGLSTTNWFFSSFPETYALTALCTTLFFALLLRQTEHDSSVLPVAGMQALASYASPQQVFLALVPCLYYLQRGQWSRQAMLRSAQYVVALGVLFCLPYEIMLQYSGWGWSLPRGYLGQWGSGDYLLDPHSYAVVFINFFLFSVIGPVISPAQYKSISLSLFEQVSWLWITVVVVYIAFIVTCLRRLRDSPAKATGLCPAILLFFLGYTFFFIYFNPEEAILYSLPVLFPWFLVLHSGFLGESARWRWSLLGLLVAVTAINNMQMILLIRSMNEALQK